ncbi:hypothetical protein MK805_05685 [Shimazuella sp. AN120528]|uniref:hypothetical protein n=1 Tax=Shimazuella soli TaxID=1892854 RepID=UPI001F10A2C6|nr:hypothetical protein [Shimazuella soli]MCH5584458.1 hypothetical protein [Shimazuella soli]
MMLPTARLKANQDTYYVPDFEGGIYFRNHRHSFRMQGSNVYQWMEKLIPMFDGTHTMHAITKGLPDTHQQRIYEFSNLLLQEGFVRDVSKDKPHSLSEKIIKRYQSQIDYLDHHVGSGAYHFEKYRHENLLVIGHGSFLTSLISSLIESGLQKIALFLTDKSNTNLERINYLETDSSVNITDITPSEIQPWSKMIQPYGSVLFAGKETDTEQIINLATLCKQENKHFIPAVTYQNTGMVGPIIDWESAWRRLAKTTDHSNKEINPTAISILANLLAFRWFQLVNGVMPVEKRQVFLLDMQTLEGKWHSFFSHPLLHKANKTIKPLASTEWLSPSPIINVQSVFTHITSEATGIFRSFGPENLLQLPLSQCLVKIADPLEQEKTISIICSALTHLEARHEAGLRGLEAYASRLFPEIAHDLKEKAAIGAGATRQEAICRAFLKYLEAGLKNIPTDPQTMQMEGEQSKYFVECISLLGTKPTLYIEDHNYGFPIGWVEANDSWFGSVGLHTEMALQAALHKALHIIQNKSIDHLLLQHIPLESTENSLEIITRHLKLQNKYLQVFDIKLEDIISQNLSVVAVTIREDIS